MGLGKFDPPPYFAITLIFVGEEKNTNKRDIYAYGLTDGKLEKLTNLGNVSTVATSDSPTQIAFLAYDNGATNVFLLDITSRDISQVTFANDVPKSYLQWSFNQHGFAFSCAGVCIVDPTSHNIMGLRTDTNFYSQNNLIPETYHGYPSLSPDGMKIAYAYWHHNNGYNYDIMVMNADGSGEKNITNSSEAEIFPVWSPDGSKIAFTHYQSLLIMNSDGGNRSRLADVSNSYPTAPAWSPDSSKLVFKYRISDDRWEIRTVTLNGKVETKLIFDGFINNVAWLPK